LTRLLPLVPPSVSLRVFSLSLGNRDSFGPHHSTALSHDGIGPPGKSPRRPRRIAGLRRGRPSLHRSIGETLFGLCKIWASFLPTRQAARQYEFSTRAAQVVCTARCRVRV